MALCGSTTACCVCVSLRQTAGMCQPGDEWSRGRRGLWTSCTVGLTCTAGLTSLWANSNSYMRFMSHRHGLLGFNEEEGCCSATESWCFLWHPACSAEWITVKSSRLTLAHICLCNSALAATVQLFNLHIWIYELKHDCPHSNTLVLFL